MISCQAIVSMGSMSSPVTPGSRVRPTGDRGDLVRAEFEARRRTFCTETTGVTRSASLSWSSEKFPGGAGTGRFRSAAAGPGCPRQAWRAGRAGPAPLLPGVGEKLADPEVAVRRGNDAAAGRHEVEHRGDRGHAGGESHGVTALHLAYGCLQCLPSRGGVGA